MLVKIVVTLLVWIMGICDAWGNITGTDVSGVIDSLNETAYYLEDNYKF